jgi:hypothetical protein
MANTTLEDRQRLVREKLASNGHIPTVEHESWELDFCIDQLDDDAFAHGDEFLLDKVCWIFACEWDCGIKDWFENFG